MKIRRFALLLLAVTLIAGACGDDDAGTPATTAASQTGATSGSGGTDSGDGGSGTTPTPSATAGFLMLGEERIEFDSARCYLQDQDAFGGGTIHATAQATGTNSAGEDVLFDFTRFGADTDFEGDDIIVTVGDYTTGDSIDYNGSHDVGFVSVEGSTVSAEGFMMTSFDVGDAPAEVSTSFEVNC